MPRPVYIICCESGSVDNVTGLPSYFNVYDTLLINIQELPPGTTALTPLLRLRVSALWMRNDQDESGENYEHQLTLQIPGEQQERVLTQTAFVFDQPYRRFDTIIQGSPFTSSGICLITSKIRRAGEQEWLGSQDYPIRVQVTRQAHQETVETLPAN